MRFDWNEIAVKPPRLLHVFSTFNVGGPQMRAVQLMNAWGARYHHLIVSVGRGELAARERLEATVVADFPAFPDLKSGSLVSRLWAIRTRVRELKPDLVLTYNWGAMEVVMSARLFGLGPLIHHEDGFGPDEINGQLPRRVWFRRLALPGARRLMVPSRTLERAARQVWLRPQALTGYIPNGVAVDLYDFAPSPTALPRLNRTDGLLQAGTVAGLRPEKNLKRLVRVFAAAAHDLNARLVIVGTGPEHDGILAEAQACNIADRVHLTGFLADPHRYAGLFDVFALTSDTEQFPISLVEAMAARLPAVCTGVGDIGEILSPENLPFVADKGDEAALAEAMRKLLLDANLRGHIGAANRARVERDFSLATMISAYEQAYVAAMDSGA